MKNKLVSLAGAIALSTVCRLAFAGGQQPRPGTVIVPPSNAERPQDVGVRAHTNFLIFIPAGKGKKPTSGSSGPNGETPSSLACVYQTGSGTSAAGCPTSGGNYDNPSGGSRAIAVVDAYNYPTASGDFQTFSKQFGLPYGNSCGSNGASPCLTVVYATAGGKAPKNNCSWAQEEALDIEWSHAMAPKAQIFLVEAASSSLTNLLNAVQAASKLVAQAGGGEVSMSWGSSEFSGESGYDSNFTASGITYFASSGDSGGKVIWPSASPNVVSAGGTTVNRNSSGDFTGETTWTDAGGGPSADEGIPAYQSYSNIEALVGTQRGTPDFSFDANPSTGVSVYDSTSCQGLSGWLVFGGTSVAAPSLSGIANLAGHFYGGYDGGAGGTSEQSVIYNTYEGGNTSCTYADAFNDITSGASGSYSALPGWDFATGVGSNKGTCGK